MRDVLKVYLPAVLVVVAAFWAASRFVGAPPPDTVRIATGSAGGAYARFADAYAADLGASGITLEVVHTAGSVQNLELLERGEVDIAMVQGGTGRAAGKEGAGLRSLGSFFLEPLWAFVRADAGVESPPDLLGKRLAVGAEGSGTRYLILELLRSSGNLGSEGTELLPLGSGELASAFTGDEIDAGFVVAAAEAPVLVDIVATPGVELLSLDNGEAYTRHYRYLSRVELPAMILDLERRLPAEPVVTIAPAANLVVREDFHPALVSLVLGAGEDVHGDGGLVEARGQFPADAYLEFPIYPDAERWFEQGPPFLQRYMPFWAANLVDRLKVMLLPIVGLLIPVVRIMPPIYQWRIRSRIYRWYEELRRLDPEGTDELSADEVERRLAELDRVESEVKDLSVPVSYADRAYNLRMHIELVRARLDALTPD